MHYNVLLLVPVFTSFVAQLPKTKDLINVQVCTSGIDYNKGLLVMTR